MFCRIYLTEIYAYIYRFFSSKSCRILSCFWYVKNVKEYTNISLLKKINNFIKDLKKMQFTTYAISLQ